MLGLLGYVALSSVAIYAYGYILNEQAEETLWHALLEAEFDHLVKSTRDTTRLSLGRHRNPESLRRRRSATTTARPCRCRARNPR